MSKFEKEPLEDLLKGFPQIVKELGPVIGFLSIIYDASLPREFEGLSISMA